MRRKMSTIRAMSLSFAGPADKPPCIAINLIPLYGVRHPSTEEAIEVARYIKRMGDLTSDEIALEQLPSGGMFRVSVCSKRLLDADSLLHPEELRSIGGAPLTDILSQIEKQFAFTPETDCLCPCPRDTERGLFQRG